MNTFSLITKKTKESINKVNVRTLPEAVQYFAKIKNLKIDQLLSIYEVVKK